MCQFEEVVNELVCVAEQEGLWFPAVEQEEKDETIDDNEGCTTAMMMFNNPEYTAGTTPMNLHETDVI